MNYIFQGFAVFLGVVAGAIIYILINKYASYSRAKQKLINLKFEFEFNIWLLKSFIEEIAKYRDAANSGDLAGYNGYFNLSRVISATANKMFLDGSLYKYLNQEDAGKLQSFYGEFNLNGENYINNQISQNKINFVKQKTIENIDFWEKKFQDYKKMLEEILKKFNQHYNKLF